MRWARVASGESSIHIGSSSCADRNWQERTESFQFFKNTQYFFSPAQKALYFLCLNILNFLPPAAS